MFPRFFPFSVLAALVLLSHSISAAAVVTPQLSAGPSPMSLSGDSSEGAENLAPHAPGGVTRGTLNAPGGLSASSVSSSQIDLTWLDSSSNEVGFKIESASSSTGPWTQIATTGPDVTGYSHVAMSPSTTCFYRARSYRSAGDSSYSNTASATTGAGAPSGNHIWSKRFGGTYGGLDTTDSRGVSVDPSGNAFVVGNFMGTIDLGGGISITSVASYDGFLVKYSSSGTPLWAKRVGGNTGADYLFGVATDASGNVVVAGELSSSGTDLGCGPLPTTSGAHKVLVAKFSGSNGACMWSKLYGGPIQNEAYGVAVDRSTNDVVVTGGFYATSPVDFGGVSLSAHSSLNGEPDIFLLKMAGADGRTIWAKGGFGSTSLDVGRSIAVDRSGNILMTGEFLWSVDFGAPTVPLSTGSYPDVFLVKFSSAGDPIWAKRYGDSLDQRGTDVAVDGSDNVILTGWFRGSIDPGRGALSVPFGSSGVFLAKLSPAGDCLWQKSVQDSDSLRSPAVAVDAADNVLMTARVKQVVDLGGGPLTTSNTLLQDAFVVQYDPAGSHRWSKRFTGGKESAGNDIVAAGGSNVIFTGWISGTVDFGGGPLVNGTNGVQAGAMVKLGIQG